jgi:serine/threonine-protein kinase
MATLWLADHRTLGIQVVVKVLTPGSPREATAMRRLSREARLMARVAGPHVVRVLDCEEGTPGDEGDGFLVMELLQGEDLGGCLARRQHLSLAETRTVVEHVSRALQVAHDVGVIHRDVKPENVFLAKTARGIVCKLVDFGVAKDATEGSLELTCANTLVGTASYMSPEQVVSSRDVDSRCDVWSLAVLAYACLTGREPFEGASLGALCVAIHAGRFDPPSRARPELSQAVDAFFAKAMGPDIGLRHQSAEALCEAFRMAVSSCAPGQAPRRTA